MNNIENNDAFLVENGVLRIKGTNKLFLRQNGVGQNQFDYLCGESNLSKTSIENFMFNIFRNVKYCDEKGIKYKHVIFPCKAIAYKDMFTSLGLNISSIAQDIHLNDKHVYYPKLNDIKHSWFFDDDTHCSDFGYVNIMNDVLEDVGIQIPDNRLTFKKVLRRGDLSKMGGFEGEVVDLLDDPGTEVGVHRFSNYNALPSNTGEMHLRINILAPIKKRLLLFGDSFFVGCLKYLSSIFEEILYIREPFIIKEVADCIEPDVILTGNAERYLVNVPHAEKSPPYFTKLMKNKVNMSRLGSVNQNAFERFFLPKNSGKYQEWFESLELITDVDKYKNDVSGFSELYINNIRDKAVELETVNIGASYKLMSLAQLARPNGPFINQKIKQYTKVLFRDSV